MPSEPRIVVTGRGVLTSIGEGPKEFWAALMEGRSGARTMLRTPSQRYRNPTAYEIPLADPLLPDRPELPRASALMLRTARAAVDEAGLYVGRSYPAPRIGVVVGSALLELRHAEDLLCEGRSDPRFVPDFNLSATAALEFRLQGPHLTLANACGAAGHAMATACDMVQENMVDAVLVIGVDTITESMVGLADRANLRTPSHVAPFDRSGSGPLLGEGAAALVVERRDKAVARGVRLHGEVRGSAIRCDAKSTHAPCEEGVTATIDEAFRRASIAPEAVDYVCAHGTGTDANDRTETAALKRVLGPHAYRTPVSSIKSMIGHTSGASNLIAAVASLMAIEHGAVPPTMNLEQPGEGLDLNYVPNRPQAHVVNVALVNGFGFGGTNSSILLSRAEGAF